jgi:hypothetical protein
MEKKEFDGFMEELRGAALTIARRKEILDIIHRRVNEVLEDITRRCKVDLHWYSFSTDRDVDNEDGNGSDGGYFDPYMYADWVSIVGEWRGDMGPFEDGFPTKFLYSMSDYDQIVAEYEGHNQVKDEEAFDKGKILRELATLPLETLKEIWAQHKRN